jgi:hypothetical protein
VVDGAGDVGAIAVGVLPFDGSCEVQAAPNITGTTPHTNAAHLTQSARINPYQSSDGSPSHPLTSWTTFATPDRTALASARPVAICGKAARRVIGPMCRRRGQSNTAMLARGIAEELQIISIGHAHECPRRSSLARSARLSPSGLAGYPRAVPVAKLTALTGYTPPPCTLVSAYTF